MNIKEALAENLTRLLGERKLSQSELGRKIKVSVQTINGLTKGKAGISADMISKLADALGVEETDLVSPQKSPEKVELKKQDWTQITELLSQLKTEPPIPQDILKDLAQLDPEELETAWDMVRLSIKGYRDLKKRRSESA